MEDANWKKPLILASILAAGTILVYWFEFNHRPIKEDAAEDTKKMFFIKDQTIESLLISDGSNPIRFHCLDGASKLCKPGDQSKWEILEPSKQPADDGSVNGLLSTLNTAMANEVIDLKADSPEKRTNLLRDYGLSPESRSTARTVEVKLSSGKTSAAFLGTSNPIDQSIYTLISRDGKVDDTRVFLIPAYIESSFTKSLTHWRDKKVMTLDLSKLAGFELKGQKDEINGVKKDGSWFVSSKKKSNISFPGDLESIDGLITTANYLVAKDFPAAEVLKNAKLVSKITFKTPDPVTLLVFEKSGKEKSGTDKKAFAKVSGSEVVFEIDSSAPGRLDKELKDLRMNRILSSIERFAIRKIEISGKAFGENPIILSMEGTKWMLSDQGSPNTKKEADSLKVQTLLEKLSGTRIEDFIASSQVPGPEHEKDGIDLLLSDEKGEKLRSLRFWPYNYKLYGKDRLSKREETFIVEASVSGALPWVKNFFDKKKVDPNPAPTATR